MRELRRDRLCAAVAAGALAALVGCSDAPAPDGAFLENAAILVPGVGVANDDCRTGVCRHNENCDMTRFDGAIWLVHRTALSQVLGPNSSLRVYRSEDGRSFELQSIIPAVNGRDIRDPSFYQRDGRLFIKAITRLPGIGLRDTAVDSISIETHSDDGRAWSMPTDIGPVRFGFWRVTETGGTLYSAAYEDGDLRVVLFRSQDGLHWERGAEIYGVSEDTPLETELVVVPSGRMLGLVRMDGTDPELSGNRRLRTKVCWATPPYDAWDCPQELEGVRLDGPVAFWWRGRLFVIARKHLGLDNRKRTALYEITGELDGGPIGIFEHGEVPSAGDTSYAGVAAIDDHRFATAWYSSDVVLDPPWVSGIFIGSDIWQAVIDASHLPRP
ncbi:MAG TPA: sialidase family protein [Candidatus Binatia bacterium]|nr:sialidase family protein [Candidatus Binatia bacterium]